MRGEILFDASRLLSRTERGAPTGVDRVCLAYAEWLIGRGGPFDPAQQPAGVEEDRTRHDRPRRPYILANRS